MYAMVRIKDHGIIRPIVGLANFFGFVKFGFFNKKDFLEMKYRCGIVGTIFGYPLLRCF